MHAGASVPTRPTARLHEEVIEPALHAREHTREPLLENMTEPYGKGRRKVSRVVAVEI
jgi:hypothetical protein